MDQPTNATVNEALKTKHPNTLVQPKPNMPLKSQVEPVDSKICAQSGAIDINQDLSKAYAVLGITACSTSCGSSAERATPCAELKKSGLWKEFQLKQTVKKPNAKKISSIPVATTHKQWGRPLREGFDYYYDQRKFFLTADEDEDDDDDDCYVGKPFRISDSDSD